MYFSMVLNPFCDIAETAPEIARTIYNNYTKHSRRRLHEKWKMKASVCCLFFLLLLIAIIIRVAFFFIHKIIRSPEKAMKWCCQCAQSFLKFCISYDCRCFSLSNQSIGLWWWMKSFRMPYIQFSEMFACFRLWIFPTIHRRELLQVWRVDWNGYIKIANDQSEWKEYVNMCVCVCVWVFTLCTANNAWHILQIHMIFFVAVCSYFLQRGTNNSWIFFSQILPPPPILI